VDCDSNSIVSTTAEGKLNRYHAYAVIHPGGKTVKGMGLSVDNYSKIINTLEKRYNLFCFIIGDHSELDTIQKISGLTNPDMTFCVTDLNLKRLSCLIKYATLFIGNDSGPCHIADAVGTPGIIIYPPMYNLKEHLNKWKPQGDNYIAVYPPVTCEACEHYPCNDSLKAKCIEKIDIESVLHYTEQILNKR
ncbi:MAG: glycosyltransferase family 9 protein, partial [bacterium]